MVISYVIIKKIAQIHMVEIGPSSFWYSEKIAYYFYYFKFDIKDKLMHSKNDSERRLIPL